MGDISNWQSVILTSIFIPITLFLYSKRNHGSIKNLDIVIKPSSGRIQTGADCPYLILDFINNTGQIIYISNATIEVTKRLKAHEDADMDIATQRYSLKFLNQPDEEFNKLQVTLNTGERGTTGLPLSSSNEIKTLINEMRQFERLGFFPWYLTLRFDAMIGRDLRRIKFNY